MAQAIAFTVGLQDMDAVRKAIKQCSSESFVSHHLNPVFKGQIGSDDQACPFVGPTNDFEEQFCPCF